ncbi:Uma2 family endonuclease [Aureimonas sp. AU40]|uniref:Uma2 family endonuclease n=1 Tax=Aureimonas sp. AU40 TaxID=1637747 RepID=UPI0007818F11|nr:Uma2 family endonuclease [Aureimonas sp. AU40]
MRPTQPATPWSIPQFPDWQAGEEGLYELVDGFPLRLADGLPRRHDRMVVNLVAFLGGALRGSPFALFSRRCGVETRPGQIRRPDLGVDAGPTAPDSFLAGTPLTLFDILERQDFDRLRKIGEHKAMPFLRHIVLLEQDQPVALLWSRLAGSHWDERRIEGLDETVPLPAINVELPLREVYDRVLA